MHIRPSSNNLWKIYIFFGVLLYFIIINQFIRVRPDHILLALLLLCSTLGKDKVRRFIADWLPFVLFWIAYDMLRGLADGLLSRVHISEPYHAEQFLFGGLFNGSIPAFWWQEFQSKYDHHIFKKVIDIICGNFYSFHFATPLLTGWILWHTTNDRRMYYRFVYTLTMLNVMALATFLLYPAAPPWYVFKYGFIQPAGELIGTAGSLVNIDRMIQLKFFTTIWDNMNPNHFAAIPSLHGAYPILVSFFLYKKFKKFPLLLLLYPIGTWFSSLYLNHHYVIDLLVGGTYAYIAYWIVDIILMPKLFDRTILKESWETFPSRTAPVRKYHPNPIHIT